ncbi:MAG: class I tRNA ligase family protein [Patescibacteria group bacterium]
MIQPIHFMVNPEENNKKSTHAEREERILAFWKERGIFEKSLEKKSTNGKFTFYDGPPFANGLPHYGHILAGIIKDTIPRWKTMQGYHVERRWGWDCHGLPVENLVEKELGLKSKKEIVDYGIEKFNQAARESVMRYADEWRKIVPRLGRWVDMDHDYRTMDASYTETVWWIFKRLHDRGLIYEGFKLMNLCPRCETTLSNFEVAQGYKDITDISVTAKFELINEPGTYILAWTTTPWTLPGNVALAISTNIDYVKIRIIDDITNLSKFFILARNQLSVLKDKKYEVVESFKGLSLIGKSYKPLFDYYSRDPNLKNREHGWKIYGADFVTTEDGTGIVHIAPAFGADDYDLSLKNNLPFVQHVSIDGTFKKEVTDFAGLRVKPIDTENEKDAHQKTDIEIIKFLARKDLLFAKEKLVHPYPHCWRCDTPLLNYATSSWFVKVTDIRDKLVAENKKITWVPPEVGSARFGNWLEGARDWAISRSRFWGAPIPVWKEEKDEKSKARNDTQESRERYHVMGSVGDLKKFSKAKNNYWIMRHGEADSNVEGILSGDSKAPNHLTLNGRQQVEKAAKSLSNIKFDLVFVSPFVRTQDTMEILRDRLGWNKNIIRTDDRIREMESGVMDGKSIELFFKQFADKDRFVVSPEGGETYVEIKKRMGDFLYDLERKYQDKNILIITHETPGFLLMTVAQGMNREQSLIFRGHEEFLLNAEVKKLDFTPLPHNSEYELDLHRPFIDDLGLKTSEGNKLVRVPDVFDCWLESGSMPYGENHYPFESAQDTQGRFARIFEPESSWFKKSQGYPADFIAEGVDQTRGWFYSMLVLGVALFGKAPYKKVIVNGLVLAEDGQKMAKRKNNYPNPMSLVDKYGADSLRYYLLSSPVVRGQDLRFSEKGVDEITKKLINRLLNVVSFYEMYKDQSKVKSQKSKVESQNVLDQWIIARLNETITAVTVGLESGELDRASWPLMDLTDDISTWYLRRSRERFKGDNESDKNSALETTRFILLQVSKLLAPFTPFIAEEIYRKIKNQELQIRDDINGSNSDSIQSVHLELWPTAGAVDSELIKSMKLVRDLASKGLEARMMTKINVRQPLQSLRIKNDQGSMVNSQLVDLIKDEVNVKEIAFGAKIETDVQLDVNITPELKEEGMVRELIRAIQDLRKEKGLSVNDKVILLIETDDAGRKFIEKNSTKISSVSLLGDITFKPIQKEGIIVGGSTFKLDI